MAGRNISVLDTVVRHALGFALELRDHFSGRPVEEELEVSAAGGKLLPARTSDGRRRAQDGTYRFVDLPAASYAVEYSSPSGRYGSWDPPLSVDVPLADPRTPVRRDLWPTPAASAPLGTTAIRGQVKGSTFKGVKVEIFRQGDTADRFTRSDSDGELLFLLPRLAPVNDKIPLTISLNGGALPITGIDVIRAGVTTHFASEDFSIVPGVESRVKFQVA